MTNILDDLDESEVKIRINSSTLDYSVEIGMIKANVLYTVLKDIVDSMEKGTFFEGEYLNIYTDPKV